MVIAAIDKILEPDNIKTFLKLFFCVNVVFTGILEVCFILFLKDRKIFSAAIYAEAKKILSLIYSRCIFMYCLCGLFTCMGVGYIAQFGIWVDGFVFILYVCALLSICKLVLVNNKIYRVFQKLVNGYCLQTIKDEICKTNSDLNVIIELIDNNPNFNINMIDDDDLSLLHNAVGYDKYEIVKYFINELNANIHIRDNDNRTPIMLAKSSNVLIFLIDNGANMYDVTNNGENVLMRAVYWNRKDVIETLINKYDYNIDMKDNENRTIFHYYFCKNKGLYDYLVSNCKNNDLNRLYVLQEFIDIGCDNTNNDDISSSIQGISYNEAHERALQNLNDIEKTNEELLQRQIANERIPLLFDPKKGAMFDYRLVGMIFEYINTKPLIPKWNGVDSDDFDFEYD